jgi:uncharacterized protein (TIGR00730 family)
MPSRIRSVAVFCGSRPGGDPAHRAAAVALGRGLAEAGITLVYGAGGIGLMGAVSDAALAAGGAVHGVIPEFLTRVERPSQAPMTLEVTDSMHARKTRMYELSDAFVVLSGGLGTMDEAVEVITWRQLGLHDKPILLLDIAGWARPFVALVEALIGDGFVPAANRRLFQVVPDVEAALELLRSLAPSPGPEAPAERL